uniref:Uncharacterized protein n=1 Tax=Glossina brevipalpis TaxID=37001 RepID=A0A1A9X3U6_9MUSC
MILIAMQETKLYLSLSVLSLVPLKCFGLLSAGVMSRFLRFFAIIITKRHSERIKTAIMMQAKFYRPMSYDVVDIFREIIRNYEMQFHWMKRHFVRNRTIKFSL